jgi:hypothetical protein
MSTNKVKLGKKYNFPANVFIINKGIFATCSNASITKVTLTMRPDLKARTIFLSDPSWCGGRYYAIVDEW